MKKRMLNTMGKAMGLFTVFLCTLFMMSCAYHLGAPDLKNCHGISVGVIGNSTSEPALSIEVKKALQEQFETAPGLTGRGSQGKYVLTAEVVEVKSSSLARAEIRDKKIRNDEEDAYQTVLYRVEIKVNYSIHAKDGGNAEKLSGTVFGKGDLPRMHDRNVPLQAAIRQASNDAARQIKNAVVDADWK